MKKKEIIELLKEEIVLLKTVNQHNKRLIDQFTERYKETTVKDLKIENLKSIIEDCKIELEERIKKISELKNENEEYREGMVNLETSNKKLNSIIEQKNNVMENKTLLIDKLDKQLTKLVYQTVTDQKHIESLRHELKYYKDKEFKYNCIKL